MDTLSELLTRLEAKRAQRPPRLQRQNYKRDAAVLLPLIQTTDGVALLFEVRSKKLKAQPREICFPGGRVECTDGDYASTALRETSEELGLPAASVHVDGPLDWLLTSWGVLVQPFVGHLDLPMPPPGAEETGVASPQGVAGNGVASVLHGLRPNPDEVDELFYVPVQYLLTHPPRTARVRMYSEIGEIEPPGLPLSQVPGMVTGRRERPGFDLYFYEYAGHVIWGMTAEILHGFLARFEEELRQ